jgi:hypothetical protein
MATGRHPEGEHDEAADNEQEDHLAGPAHHDTRTRRTPALSGPRLSKALAYRSTNLRDDEQVSMSRTRTDRPPRLTNTVRYRQPLPSSRRNLGQAAA